MSIPLQFFRSSFAKSLATFAVCFAGVIAGVLLGTKILNRPAQAEPKLLKGSPDIPHMILAAGDLFPLEQCWVTEGQKQSFQELLQGTDAMVYFATFHCGPCLELLQFRQAQMHGRVRPGVRELVCVPSDAGSVPAEYQQLIKGATLVYYDRERWKQVYHQVFWPTLVGVDNSGFITHVQYGFEGSIDYQLAERFLQDH